MLFICSGVQRNISTADTGMLEGRTEQDKSWRSAVVRCILVT